MIALQKCLTQKTVNEKFGCAVEGDAEVDGERADSDPSLKADTENQDTTYFTICIVQL
jgi:hypothetical protein